MSKPKDQPRFARYAMAKRRGFTLIELLVSLVIVGFAMAVVSSAMSQVVRLLGIASNQSQGFSERWLQNNALADVVANFVIDPALEFPLEGGRDKFTCISTSELLNANGAPRRAEIKLRQAIDGQNLTQLFLASSPASGALPSESNVDIRLAQYKGRVSFKYTDDVGVDHDQWPPISGITDRLPRKISIRSASEPDRWLSVASFEGPTQPLRRKAGNLMPGLGL